MGLSSYLILINIAVARKRTVTYLQKIHCVFFSFLNSRGFSSTNKTLLPILIKNQQSQY